MTEQRTMNSAVTAWKNGNSLGAVFTPTEIETYRAVYIKAFDVGVSARMKNTGRAVLSIFYAIEDAQMDRIGMGQEAEPTKGN